MVDSYIGVFQWAMPADTQAQYVVLFQKKRSGCQFRSQLLGSLQHFVVPSWNIAAIEQGRSGYPEKGPGRWDPVERGLDGDKYSASANSTEALIRWEAFFNLPAANLPAQCSPIQTTHGKPPRRPKELCKRNLHFKPNKFWGSLLHYKRSSVIWVASWLYYLRTTPAAVFMNSLKLQRPQVL